MPNIKTRIENLEKNLTKKCSLDRPSLPILGGYPDKPHRNLTQDEIELLKLNNLSVPICVSIDFDINKYLSS